MAQGEDYYGKVGLVAWGGEGGGGGMGYVGKSSRQSDCLLLSPFHSTAG